MNGFRLKRALVATSSVAALSCGAFAAQADAHATAHSRAHFHPHWYQGYYGDNAVVTGTVTGTPGTDSFQITGAALVGPGAGNSSSPYSTPYSGTTTITDGAHTKVISIGQNGIEAGDTVYVIYHGVSTTDSLAQITAGTPTKIVAFTAPTPEVEVEGTVTATPSSSDPGQFTATAEVVKPVNSYAGHGQGGYSYGFGIQGGYGWNGGFGHNSPQNFGHGGPGVYGGFSAQSKSAGKSKGAGTDPYNVYTPSGGYSEGQGGTTITVSTTTQFEIDGNRNATVTDLQAGDHFVAVFDGTPSESLSQITATPAMKVDAWAGPAFYGFVGSVVSSTQNGVTVNVTNSRPTGEFSGSTTFTISPWTWIFAGPHQWGAQAIQAGDLIAGGEFGFKGESAATIEKTPLTGLAIFPNKATAPYGSGSGSGTTYYSESQLKKQSFRKSALKKANKLVAKYKG